MENHFNGILVVNPKTTDTLLNHNAKKYFIPASTVKIFTFYTGLQLLEDKIPALKYELNTDTLFVQGTGDPTFLNPNILDDTAYNFLRKFPKVYVNLTNYEGDTFMPGWAWEDYPYYFSPEVTAFPIHRNVVEISNDTSLYVNPKHFTSKVKVASNKPNRKRYSNDFYVQNFTRDTLQIPFLTSDSLARELLESELGNTVGLTQRVLQNEKVLYGIASDSLYKQMLWDSDNFTAEQLMLVSSSTLSDTLSFKKTRDFILNGNLSNLTQKPRWVDGSGLSRYNLFTPESMVYVLHEIKNEVEEKRLFKIFPTWNANGTVKEPLPENDYFIYAKSGSMGNVYNLCGYLKTKSGKLLLFSYMNNNFKGTSKAIRNEMYRFLYQLHVSE